MKKSTRSLSLLSLTEEEWSKILETLKLVFRKLFDRKSKLL